MSVKKTDYFWGGEILFNKFGQLYFKPKYLIKNKTQFFRFIS